MLYFNLPDEIIRNRIVAKRLFPRINQNATRESFPNTRDVIDFFGRSPRHRRMPNIMLFQTEGEDGKQIFGGYSSCGWTDGE